ncbi:hypothetical protein D3C72_1784130 [compost metagenome]
MLATNLFFDQPSQDVRQVFVLFIQEERIVFQSIFGFFQSASFNWIRFFNFVVRKVVFLYVLRQYAQEFYIRCREICITNQRCRRTGFQSTEDILHCVRIEIPEEVHWNIEFFLDQFRPTTNCIRWNPLSTHHDTVVTFCETHCYQCIRSTLRLNDQAEVDFLFRFQLQSLRSVFRLEW